jgi:hypothetical protein
MITAEYLNVTGRFCRLPCLTLALAIALSVSQTHAQTVEHPPEHPPLQKSTAIEFADAFEQALQQAPEDLLTQSARQQASSAQSIAERWIVGAPAWQGSVINDRLLSDRGLRELETGVAVNIWRPGERDDARALGTAYQQRSAAIWRHLNWQICRSRQLCKRSRMPCSCWRPPGVCKAPARYQRWMFCRQKACGCKKALRCLMPMPLWSMPNVHGKY